MEYDSSESTSLPPSHLDLVVDCAEGTVRQFILQPHKPNVPRARLNRITKLFVTHMHADHIMGIPTLLRNLLRAPHLDAPPLPNAIAQRKSPIIEIFGPCGLRSFVRQNLKMTFTHCDDNYVVHELLRNDDPITPCISPPNEADPLSGFNPKDWDILHCNELPGRDIHANSEGLWHDVTSITYSRRNVQITVNASSILHREPCIGYVFDETTLPKRKVVILGDTYDPSSIIPLCSNPSPSLLIHEATDSTVSPETDNGGRLSKRSLPEVMKTALARGHSTPTMAGEFAKRISAQKLVLNHIGSRFPAPRLGDNGRGFARRVLDDLEGQATRAWDPPSGGEAIVALDFMRVSVPEPQSSTDVSASGSDVLKPSKHPPSDSDSVSPSEFPGSLPQISLHHTEAAYTLNSVSWGDRVNLNENPSSTISFGGFADSGLMQTTGQPDYYDQRMGYDPMQMAQYFHAFVQMVHLAVEAGAGAETDIGVNMGLKGPEVGTRTGPEGVLIPMPVDEEFPTVIPEVAPTTQPHAVADLERLEYDPVIARNIAAAGVKYEYAPSSHSAG